MFLTADDLIELTGRRRRDAQALVLRAMSIEHRIRPDGTIAVLRAHVERVFGEHSTSTIRKRKVEPDFSTVS